MDLTPHEQKILDLVKKHPEVLDDREARAKLAEEIGLSEKTLRNRIGDLKKYGVLYDDTSSIVQSRKLNKKKWHLPYIVYIIMGEKYRIISIVALVSLLAIVISLLLPKTYKSTAVILPPEGGIDLGFGSFASQLPLSSFGLGSENQLTNKFLAILESRNLREKVLNEFHLIEKYESDNVDRALEELSNNTYINLNERGTISISVYDRDQDIVKNIVNYYVVLLDSLVRNFSTEKARNNRIFIESQIEYNRSKLEKAEERLKLFSEKWKYVSPEVQIEEEIKLLGELKSRIIEVESQLRLLLSNTSVDNPEIIMLKEQLDHLQDKYDILLGKVSNSEIMEDIFFPVSMLPQLSLQFYRLKRNIELQTKILEYLIPEYEKAKIQESKDTPSLQALDFGAKPAEKAKPHRALIVLLAFTASLFLSSYYFILRDKYYR